MKKLLEPDMKANSIKEVPLDELYSKGINTLIIDLDNTVTEWRALEVEAAAADWFTLVKQKGFKAGLVSNNKSERVSVVAEKLGIPFISRANKPRRRAFKRALEILGSDVHQTAVIGDQIFTDILGGNRMEMFTILVEPISRKEFFGTKVFRFMEKLISRKNKDG